MIRLARENARWVYLRIRGELKRLVDGPVGVFGTHSLKQWRGIASRHDKYAITYLGGVILATIVLNHRVRI